MKKIWSLPLVALGCLVLSCSESTRQKPDAANPSAQIIATVDGYPITIADLHAEVERRTSGRPLAAVSPEERDALLQQMVRRQSVYARAVADGFDQSPVVRRQVQELIASRYLEKSGHDAPKEISDGDVQRYYDENGDKFAVAAQVRFAVIRIGVSPKATAEKRVEARQKAEAILDQARAGGSNATFGALARLHSEDQATRYLGGDAGWISQDNQDRWSGPVAAAALALENPGDLGPVVSASDAFYLVQLLDRKPATRRPLSEVKAAIAYQLSVINRERVQAQFFKDIQASQKIEINRALLESLSSPVQQTEVKPPGVPAG